MPPDLATPRLRLRPVEAHHAHALTALLGHPDVRRYLCDDELIPREAVAAWIRDSLDPASITACWRIETAAAGMIGVIGIQPPTRDALRLRNIGWRSLELIVALDPAHWGRGYACEAVTAVATHAGGDGVTFALVAATDAPNERSHRLLRRCGFDVLGHAQGPAHPLVIYERSV